MSHWSSPADMLAATTLADDSANGTRGWIMCVVSGVACVSGASIICVDVLVRLFPGQKRFRIEESNAFLACSLSLSFGVMIFSALYNMLPASKHYLLVAGWGDNHAGFLMMGCFIGGFIGIQAVSRLLHRLMPSHVVDCDHTHDEPTAHDEAHPDHGDGLGRRNSRQLRRRPSKGRCPGPIMVTTLLGQSAEATESTPLLPSERAVNGGPGVTPKDMSANQDPTGPFLSHHSATHPLGEDHIHASRAGVSLSIARRPSIIQVRDRLVSFVKDTKANCDEMGPCYGYTDPCGQECFKHMSSRSALSRLPTALRTTTWFAAAGPFPGVAEEGRDDEARSPGHRLSRAQSCDTINGHSEHGDPAHHGHHGYHEHDGHHHDFGHNHSEGDSTGGPEEDVEAQHHHHVPTNAFMAIGLQTVIAIALHKFPEGFITYATNIANPALGFNVFMALFVHNIAEGFSMALPLYMALGSKFKAILLSSVLGGLSQPAGAAIAWLWFSAARRSHFQIDNVAYAVLFAVTAGIMASVALQLFVESLSLNHNRNLSIAFAFLGMVLLGISSALVDDE